MGKRSSGLLFGLVAGTVLGILFAPKKGKSLRDKIVKEREKGGYGLEAVKNGFIGLGKEIAGVAKETYESDEVQEKLGMARSKAEEMADEAVEEGKKKVRKYTRRAKTAAKKTAKKVGRKAGKFTKKKIGK